MLDVLPRIDVLDLGRITTVPEWHPEHGVFQPFPVLAWVVHHPDGPIVVDAGVGVGNPLIDEWYRPEVVAIDDALGSVGVAVADVVACVVSHLHFDHCGQLGALSCPVHVQRVEHDLAQQRGYTVPEWAAIPTDRLRLLDGDAEIAAGVRAIATPGHTPGHQSVVIDGGGDRVVLGGQCAFVGDELVTGEPRASNLDEPASRATAVASLARIRALAPVVVHLSHDPTPVVVG